MLRRLLYFLILNPCALSTETAIAIAIASANGSESESESEFVMVFAVVVHRRIEC